MYTAFIYTTAPVSASTFPWRCQKPQSQRMTLLTQPLSSYSALCVVARVSIVQCCQIQYWTGKFCCFKGNSRLQREIKKKKISRVNENINSKYNQKNLNVYPFYKTIQGILEANGKILKVMLGKFCQEDLAALASRNIRLPCIAFFFCKHTGFWSFCWNPTHGVRFTYDA